MNLPDFVVLETRQVGQGLGFDFVRVGALRTLFRCLRKRSRVTSR